MRCDTDKLLGEEMAKPKASTDDLMRFLEERRDEVLRPVQDGMRRRLPRELERAVERTLEQWRASDGVRRLHARDATLWTGRDEAKWLDWLDVVYKQIASLSCLHAVADEVKRGGFTHAALLGMGGSSLCPEVLARTFPARAGHVAYPLLAVLDSTDPAQIAAFASRLDADRTLFIVSSKSGATLETDLLEAFFYELMVRRRGAAAAGSRFIAVTDPGSPLAQRAQDRGYAHTFLGVPGIGGRYSALSNFGMVPAAGMGVDVERLLARACAMVMACAPCEPLEDNPGAALGIVLGAAARAGRDKVTFVASPPIEAFGAWIEQLLAESTGKGGTGLLPVDREPLGPPEVYGSDRVFVYLRLDDGVDPAQDAAIAALEAADQPTVRIALADAYDLGQEFFRWQFATAVAGAILGVHPFDQPDVEASKIEARRLIEQYERTSALPADAPFFEEEGLSLFADRANRDALERASAGDTSLRGYLRAHFARLSRGDYCALLAWIERSDPLERRLEEIRCVLRDRLRVATCLEFGPRYLHSTGQAYKGGPSTGAFLQITADDPIDLPVPGHRFTFGVVKQAQARGDFEILAQRGRRALRLHLGADLHRGLETLARAAREVLAA